MSLFKTFKYCRSLPRILFAFFRDKVLLKKTAAIFMYHSVSLNSEFFTVTPENFEMQMEYLYKNKYNVVALSSLVDYVKKGIKIPTKTVVITFDDGYEDNYLHAFPLLKKFCFPASIFLVTNWIGNKKYKNKRGIEMPMLDWGQIKEMHDSGLVDFEPHTASHPRLSRIHILDVEDEINKSKDHIERRLGKRCNHLCLPFGDYNTAVLDIVKNFFESCLTVDRGFVGKDDDPFKLKRNSIDSRTSKFMFKLKV